MNGSLKKQEFDAFMLPSNLKRSITRAGLTVDKKNSPVIYLRFNKKGEKNGQLKMIGPASWDLVKKGYKILSLFRGGMSIKNSIKKVLKYGKIKIIPEYLEPYVNDIKNEERVLELMGEDSLTAPNIKALIEECRERLQKAIEVKNLDVTVDECLEYFKKEG